MNIHFFSVFIFSSFSIPSFTCFSFIPGLILVSVGFLCLDFLVNKE